MELTILCRAGADFSVSAASNTSFLYASGDGKSALIAAGARHLLADADSDYDLILTEPSVISVLGFWAKLIKKTKWVVDIWDIPIRCHSASYLTAARCRILRWMLRILYRWADFFLVSIIPEFELKYFRLPPQKLLPLTNAIWLDDTVDTIVQPCTEDTFSVICMRSTYTADMGLDTVTEALALLSAMGCHIKLFVVGIIPQSVENQVRELRVAPNVIFLPSIEHGDLMRLVKEASVCVVPFKDVPDLAQTYPVKVLEYLSLGKAVIASDIAGIRRMIRDGDNGLLFTPGSAQNLAAQIFRLKQDPSLCIALGANAQALDRIHDCRLKAAMIISALEKIVKEDT